MRGISLFMIALLLFENKCSLTAAHMCTTYQTARASTSATYNTFGFAGWKYNFNWEDQALLKIQF